MLLRLIRTVDSRFVGLDYDDGSCTFDRSSVAAWTYLCMLRAGDRRPLSLLSLQYLIGTLNRKCCSFGVAGMYLHCAR